MNDEVRAMISEALRDEPPVGVDYESVLAAGRRRRVRRQFGIVGGAVLGVAMVVSSAVVVGRLSESPKLTPAAPTTSTTTSTPAPATAGCVIPAFTGGFSDAPAGNASQEELAESARLTEAFGRFPFPLPSGVTMDPAKPRLCVIKASWGARFGLHSPVAERTVFLEVRPRAAQPADVCPAPSAKPNCEVRTFADGTTVLVTVETARTGGEVPIASAVAWRTDDTLVRVMETGPGGDNPPARILDDKALIAIAAAPELKVAWSRPALPQAASDRRAADLSNGMAKIDLLPAGMRAERIPQSATVNPLAFFRSQGGYKLNADLVDAAGSGNLFINLSPPDAGASIGCRDQPRCEPVTLPDNRKATLTRQDDGAIVRYLLETLATDGTQVTIMTSNQSEKAQSQGKTAPTRPTPSLSPEDLVKLAALPWLRWN